MARNNAEATGKHEQRRPVVEQQLRAALRHDGVVTAEHDDHVAFRERLIQAVVAPELVDKWTDPWVHGRIPLMRTLTSRLMAAAFVSALAMPLAAQQTPPPGGGQPPANAAAQAAARAAEAKK